MHARPNGLRRNLLHLQQLSLWEEHLKGAFEWLSEENADIRAALAMRLGARCTATSAAVREAAGAGEPAK
jgi:hypothetical protein